MIHTLLLPLLLLGPAEDAKPPEKPAEKKAFIQGALAAR